jgi:ABC-type uncharacterized transport system substrate-binding protein
MLKTSLTAFPNFSSDNLKSKIQNLKWTGFLAVVIAFAGMAGGVEAQQPKKVTQIGYLTGADAATESARSEGIRLALRERGYIEGQNIAIEYRYAEGKRDQLPALAAELVRLNVNIIVTGGGESVIEAAKKRPRRFPSLWWVAGPILSRQAMCKALPVPAAISPALQTLAEN